MHASSRTLPAPVTSGRVKSAVPTFGCPFGCPVADGLPHDSWVDCTICWLKLVACVRVCGPHTRTLWPWLKQRERGEDDKWLPGEALLFFLSLWTHTSTGSC